MLLLFSDSLSTLKVEDKNLVKNGTISQLSEGVAEITAR